jgi:3-mercaptopropionate dioxygenase
MEIVVIKPLRNFVQAVTRAANDGADEEAILPVVKSSMLDLVENSGWLPEEFAEPAGKSYGQHLLYCDPLERFCVVSFVWCPGQSTPVHDHTVWGVIGQLIGEEESQSYIVDASEGLRAHGGPQVLRAGEICTVSPRDIDVHVVRNPNPVSKSIGIHAYGANIARVRRHTYDLASGRRSDFFSSYTNERLPNIWN